MTTMMFVSIGLAIINFILLLLLLQIYFSNYKRYRAQFNLGLLLFVIAFLVQKVGTVYVFMFKMMEYASELSSSLFILEILQTIAFSFLVYISYK